MIVFANQHQFFKGGRLFSVFHLADLRFFDAKNLRQLVLRFATVLPKFQKPLGKNFSGEQDDTPLASLLIVYYNESMLKVNEVLIWTN